MLVWSYIFSELIKPLACTGSGLVKGPFEIIAKVKIHPSTDSVTAGALEKYWGCTG